MSHRVARDRSGRWVKCSPQTLRKRAASGEIPRYGIGGEWRYYAYDLLDYVMGASDDRASDRSGDDPERAKGEGCTPRVCGDSA